MQYIKLFILIILTGFTGSLTAQTTLLNQSLLTEPSFNTFTPISVTGIQTWEYNSMYGAVCSGYFGGIAENEDWLISPAINLTQTDNVKLTFSHTRGNAAVFNVGVAEGWYKVYATSNFTGDPTTTGWIELSYNQNIPTAWQYVSSGEIIIPEAAISENSRFAFRYVSSATESATWEIKNVMVTGDPQPTNPNAGLLTVTNWNTEWLGCTSYGPFNETLQFNNVVAAMLAMNSDIFCLQEVTNSVSNPSIATLVSLLGSDLWDGQIVPSNTGDCDQRQGIIYKKSKIQFVSANQLSNGINAQGNSYYYNCANGRYPSVYNVNVVAGNTLVPLSLVNIHAKAEDGIAMSYTRRLGASEALKDILDGTTYNSKNLMVIGDFNDYFVGTTSGACACINSPYKNFIDDAGNYDGITENITDVDSSSGIHPIIENILITNELFDNYLPNSATQNVAVAQSINNFSNTTSDHLPVSATFQFAVLGIQDHTYTSQKLWLIYPNPVKDELTFDTTQLEKNAAIGIYDLTGRQMRCENISANSINVVTLPSGVYILKAGNKFGRFIKE